MLLQALGEGEPHAELARQLAPGRLRRRYIRYWIEKDLVNRWMDHRFIVRGLFSLAMQDRFSDMRRALKLLRKIRKASADDTRKLLMAADEGKSQ